MHNLAGDTVVLLSPKSCIWLLFDLVPHIINKHQESATRDVSFRGAGSTTGSYLCLRPPRIPRSPPWDWFCHYSRTQSKAQLRQGSSEEVLGHFLGNEELSEWLKTPSPFGTPGSSPENPWDPVARTQASISGYPRASPSSAAVH